MMTAYRATLATLVAFLAPSVPIHAGAQTGLGFKTPSNNIFCIIEDPYGNHAVSGLRCDLQQQNSMPSRPKDCPLSWGDAFSISQNGNFGVRICHGDTTKYDELMVLPYGSEWKNRGFSCRSQPDGLTCANAKGHGFMLSRAVQKLF